MFESLRRLGLKLKEIKDGKNQSQFIDEEHGASFLTAEGAAAIIDEWLSERGRGSKVSNKYFRSR